ncbi:MAG TPA: tRNA (adenosine(37)-N6)-threonylcarbamoyltransferase complex dimerization subunit type 1 TsaB, partial [Clostridiales bacterium]|nr:tRNA (adenosine(37)-N6)-threonylcarbamoyltransferase complex dimerization subunit type 1 TsaB [Clostridiales bacterium]
VRIGAALVKGLAFGRNIPCVGVSTLEALAENLAGLPGLLLPVMDARRAQVYTATFRSENGVPVRLSPDRAVAIDALVDELRDAKEAVLPVGDGTAPVLAALRKAGIPCLEVPVILLAENAVSVGRVAYRKYLAGEATDDEALRPTYLRLPQAERERLAKEGQNQD